jgi:DNA-directed RNA polymerase subunit M/transcription elongation factor TFIIS
MNVIDKNLHDSYSQDAKVSFMYECESCKFRKILYSDGSAWDYKAPKCPECNSELKNKYIQKGEILTETTTCTKCKYKEVVVTDFKKNRLEQEKEEKRKADLFKEWRERFCLTDVNGPDAVANIDGIVRIVKEWRERDKKEKDPIFQQAKKLNVLKINQLKVLINKTIIDHGYSDLQFGQPEMDKFVIVNFTATDSNAERKEFDSTNTLRKLISSVLETTNWRLMSEGIHCRLGIVSGRLKAYEREDDLVGLVKDKN